MSLSPEEKERVRAMREGYREVNRREVEELRALSPDERLQILALLMRSGADFPPVDDEAELAEVRARWLRLKRRA